MRKGFRLFCLTIIMILMLSGCSAGDKKSTYAINGVLSFSSKNLTDTDIVSLNGEWEFYWKELLDVKDLKAHTPDELCDVPESWIFYDNKFSGEGYATYHLHVVTTNPAGTMMALKLPTFSSAYELYINDKRIASNGKVGKSEKEEIPESKPLVAAFAIPDSEFEILIHVSNYHYSQGGFWNLAYIGDLNAILEYQDSVTREESILLGALLVVSLFFMAVYIINRQFRYSLYFALTCMSLGVLLDVIGELSIGRLLPFFTYNQSIWLWYSSILCFLLSLNLYLNELFPSKLTKLVLRVFFIYYAVAELICTFTSPKLYGHAAYFTNGIDILWLFCMVIIVMYGVWNKRKGSIIYLASLIVALTTYSYVNYVGDTLVITDHIQFDLTQIKLCGTFTFLFLQMIIQAGRIREFQLKVAASELDTLHAQIKPHFLFNVLNTIISISRYDAEKSRELLIEFSNYLRKSFDYKSSNQFILLKNEMEHLQSYINIEKARFEERLEVSYELPDNLNYKVPILMLQPIVENAIIHGVLPKPEGGKILIKVKEEKRTLEFTVSDNGVGFDSANLPKMKNKQKSGGVGLQNINLRLRKMFGNRLMIISTKEIGTEIKWSIPMIDREA